MLLWQQALHHSLFNPLKSVQTMTGYIVQISMGDVPYGTLEYKTIFAVGTLLFIITFILNIISRRVVKSVNNPSLK